LAGGTEEQLVRGGEHGERERAGIGPGPDPAETLLGLEVFGDDRLDLTQHRSGARVLGLDPLGHPSPGDDQTGDGEGGRAEQRDRSLDQVVDDGAPTGQRHQHPGSVREPRRPIDDEGGQKAFQIAEMVVQHAFRAAGLIGDGPAGQPGGPAAGEHPLGCCE
jgi:hypothetical protein